jgi:DNA-binding SARP family transcriptional activator
LACHAVVLMTETRAVLGQPAGATAQAGDRACRRGAALALNLLDGFELRVDGDPLSVPFSAQRVVAFLALCSGRRGRIYVAGHLWADASEERAAASLRTALWRVGRRGSGLVRCDGQSLSLDPAVEVDVVTSSRMARDVLDGEGRVPIDVFAQLRDAGELLPDWYDEWVLIERERHRQLRLHALERLCVRLSAEGRHAAATEAGLAAVAGEPLRESAHRVLIAAHLAEGTLVEALRQYRLYCQLLRRDLNAGPSPALRALVAAVTVR